MAQWPRAGGADGRITGGGGRGRRGLSQMDVMGRVFLAVAPRSRLRLGSMTIPGSQVRHGGAPGHDGPVACRYELGQLANHADGLFMGHDAADGGKGFPSAAVSPSGGQPSNFISTRPNRCICGLSGCSVRKRLPAHCVTNAH